MLTTAIKRDVDAERARQGDASKPARIVQLTRASTIKIRAVVWTWALRLAAGTFALLGGREGIGKSTVAYTIIADVTRGRLAGAYLGNPRAAIIIATEDSWEHTIVPRLMAAGADLDRVYRAEVLTHDLGETAVSLPRDMGQLERAIGEVDAAIVLLDPLLSRLDAALDTHKDSEVRQALEPLVVLADRSRATFLGLIHVTKAQSSDALTTLMGSRAFAAVARTVLFVMADPDNPEARLLGLAKNNLGRSDLPTLSFTIAGHKVADTADGPVWTGRLEWTGESDRSIREALEAATADSGDRTATSEAADWLSDYLQSEGGQAPASDIKRKGHAAGHSLSALQRARHKLGVVAITSGYPRRSIWALQSSRARGETSTETNELNETTDSQSSRSFQSSGSPGDETNEQLDRL